MRDLAIPNGSDALRKLRSKTPKELMHVSDRDSKVNFDIESVVDGWVLPEQPATTWVQGRQVKVPVIAGSDADTRAAFIAFDTDYEFGNSVDIIAKNTARSGQKAWFYYFTYQANAKFYAGLGAFHGIEVKFVTRWFVPSHWGEPDAEDRKLIDIMTGYWAQLAKTGDPNGASLPPCPAYDPKRDLALEIGHQVQLRPTPHADRLVVFERSLKHRLESITHSSPQE